MFFDLKKMFTPEGMGAHWFQILQEEKEKSYIKVLEEFLASEEKRGAPIFPKASQVFNALLRTPYDQVKVVIVGQDPYHGPGQAHGLSFSVPKGVPFPPSLRNIFSELARDMNCPFPKNGDLSPWAEQGVLLLNDTLTVEQGKAGSHRGKGWELFTDTVIFKLLQRKKPLVIVLWGRAAQQKWDRIKEICTRFRFSLNFPLAILKAAHPSPFSAYQGFFGCAHFSLINEHLMKWGLEPIQFPLLEYTQSIQ